MTDHLPQLVAHADWGSDRRKRWLTRAVRQPNGVYRAHAPEPVGDPATLFQRLMPTCSSIFIGFDFPIGLPIAYARRAGIDDFVTFLAQAGHSNWSTFYEVAAHPHEISLKRPFYPLRPGAAKQQHLLDGLGLEKPGLRRRCDRAYPGRKAAAPLFWAMGAQQVGKAAISGWRDVLGPALRSISREFAIWPFSGPLFTLFGAAHIVAAETYPAECYTHLDIAWPRAGKGEKSGKRSQAARQANAQALLAWAALASVELTNDLRHQIEIGFGARAEGEDAFDSVVGLFGMLNVTRGHRPPANPEDDSIRKIEGWILGQISTLMRIDDQKR